MKKKKLMALLLAGMLGVSALAGCGDSSDDSSKGSDADNSTGDDANKGDDAEKEDSGDADGSGGTDELVTLKWIQVGNGMPDNYDAWLEHTNAYLEEKINVHVDMEIVPWGDWENRRSVIANSGEAFDILFTDQSRYNSEVSTGIFMDLTELLPTEAPDLYAMIPENYWKAASIEDKIYAIPTYKDSSITNYFIWDAAVAEKYNVDYQNINNVKDLATALKTIKDGEGGAPYYMSKSGADWMLSYYDQLGAGLPSLGVRYDDTEKKVVNPLEDPDVMEALKSIHQMYKDGIINGDAPTADDSNGYRNFFVAQGWSGAAKSNWGPRNTIDECEAIKYGDTVVSNTSVRGSMNGIYVSCPHPEKALQLLQLINTDTKARDMFYYGLEGENFEYTDDGKVTKLNEDWTMAGYTQGTFFNVSLLSTVDVNEWEEVEELNNSAIPSVMLGFDMDTSEVETELANCRSVYEKYRSELWTGAQDPEKLVPKMIEEFKSAGWETIRDKAQEQVDAAK